MIIVKDDRIIFEDIDDFSIVKAYAKTHHRDNMFLILREGRLIHSRQYNKKWHKYFRKVLTWDDTLVDNKKYFKYYIPQLIYERPLWNVGFANKKPLAFINSNKIGIGKGELYSERKKAIMYFDENLPGFDVYGEGWNKRQLKLMSLLHCAKNLLKFDKQSLLYAFDYFFALKKIKNYKGSINGFNDWQSSCKRCIEVLKDYKFAICYENTNAHPGYLTEKIFNCFNARCVPIYWGDPNVYKSIPKGCFIDKRWFQDYDDLTRYIVCMKQEEYEGYIDNINKFLKSDRARLFSEEAYDKRMEAVFNG